MSCLVLTKCEGWVLHLEVRLVDMRIREALSRIVIAPVIAGIILGCVSIGACAPKDSPKVENNSCGVLFLRSSDCPEDTAGWIGSPEDNRTGDQKA